VARLIMGYSEGAKPGGEGRAGPYESKKLIPEGVLPTDRRYTLVVKALFHLKEHFGFVIFGLGRAEFLYEMLREEISNAIKISRLMNERKEAERQLVLALTDLEGFNKTLADLSQRDELTGLNNRRGFMTQALIHFNKARKGRSPFLLFFMDLDYLKKINDNFGHAEGDVAIRAASQVLKLSFRDNDILGRCGGDEFIVLVPDNPGSKIDFYRKRIKEALDQFNQSSGARFPLSMGIGWSSFDGERDCILEDLIKEADASLYTHKHK
jgi:diguanylate cyclase (GGDEF)-like protein